MGIPPLELRAIPPLELRLGVPPLELTFGTVPPLVLIPGTVPPLLGTVPPELEVGETNPCGTVPGLK